jgi:ATP-dependent Clp protease ATP-binding subunit ClpC
VIPDKSRCLYKYFDLADRFVRVRVLDSSSAGLRMHPGMNRKAYRRTVIQACVTELADDVDARLRELCPEEPAVAEDLLYQLVVQVNPGLDIHAVSLRVDETAAVEPIVEKEAAGDEAYLRALRRAADGLERRLLDRIVGQPEAIGAVTRAVRRAAAGLAPEGRPLASYVFVGRTGTGKTELARALARELYGPAQTGVKRLVRIDCSEYALAHEYSKLIGAPPGYVGHEDGGLLTDAVRKTPDCVVLFDEIEKAHPRLHNLLLQVLEEGQLTDSKGRVARFDRALVIMTSNAGAEETVDAASGIGFGRTRSIGNATLSEITARALGKQFSPEFLGRIDETIVFHELGLGDAREIARRQLGELALRLRRRGHKVAFARGLADWIANRGFAPESGAREIRRVIQRDVITPLAEEFATGKRRGHLVAGVRSGRVALRAA